MTVPFSMVGEKVADILMSANYKVEMYDAENNRVYDKTQARKFFTSPDNIMVAIHEAGNEKSNLNVSLSKGIDIQEFEDKVGQRLRKIANQAGDNMAYDIRTYGRALTLKDFAHDKAVKEENEMSEINVTEGKSKMTGTTRSSYQKVGECRIIIRHSGKVNENKFGARSRNIQAIFVETKSGERFMVAENNLHGARAMARHMSNGGSPFDTVGMKVSEMMNQMSSLKSLMAEVTNAGKNEAITEDAGVLAEQIKIQFNSLRETLKKMSGKVGYMTHSADLAEGMFEDPEGFELPSDRILGKGRHAGKGTSGATLDLSKKPKISDEEVFALIASDPRYGRKHLRPERDFWDPSDHKLYKAAKAELERKMQMNSVEEDGHDMEYSAPISGGPKNPTKFSNPIGELAFKMSDHLSNYGDSMDDTDFNKWSIIVNKMNDLEHSPLTRDEAREAYHAAEMLGVQLPMKAPESVHESKVDTGKNSSAEKKDSNTTQEMFDPSRGDELARANAEAMHSINSIAIEKSGGSQKDYGVLPESAILESWFDDMVRVEFYKEEDLKMEEDDSPKVEKILPETALHTLNMYLEHPLFNHYLGLYETQGILDEVVDMMQDESELYERTCKHRRLMKEGPGNMWMHERKDALDRAFEELKLVAQSRKESLDVAIDRLATSVTDELDAGDPDAKNEAVEALMGMAQDAGMIKHDAGSQFADQVISPAEEIQTHKDEVGAEEYYGDAKFHEEEITEYPHGHEDYDEGGGHVLSPHALTKYSPDDFVAIVNGTLGWAQAEQAHKILNDEASLDDMNSNALEQIAELAMSKGEENLAMEIRDYLSGGDEHGEPMGSHDMSDDADALGSAGMGTDEYYGDYGESVREEEKMDKELKRLAELAGISVEEGKMDLKHDKNDDGDYDDEGEHITHDPDDDDDDDDKKNESVTEAKDEDVDEAKDEDVDEAKEEVDEAKDEEVDEAKDEEVDEAKDEEVDESADDKEKVEEELATDQNLARLITLARFRTK